MSAKNLPPPPPFRPRYALKRAPGLRILSQDESQHRKRSTGGLIALVLVFCALFAWSFFEDLEKLTPASGPLEIFQDTRF